MKYRTTAHVATGAAVLLLALGTGCSTVQKTTAAGGAIGAVAGAVIGHNAAASAGGGALVGAGAGAATGGLAGDAFAKVTDEDIEREIQNLRAELDARDAEIAALRDRAISEQALAELEQLRGELDARIAALDAANGRIADLEGALATAQEDANTARGRLASLESEAETARQAALTERTRAQGRENELTMVRRDLAAAESRADNLQRALDEVRGQLASANRELSVVQTTLREKADQLDSLRGELSELNVELEETNRGLTLTIVDELLFRPGKAELSTAGQQLIRDVSAIIHSNFPDRELLIEGHTDNQPIQRSGWRSNWELGSARALGVLHEMVELHGFSPDKLSATTYGEFRPAAPNATAEGRAANRRSVIVILPERLPLQRNTLASN